MPKIPFLSDEKRGACLEALRWFVRGQSDLLSKDLYSNYKQEQREQTYGRPRLMETLERPGGPRSKMGPLNLAAIQRYKKLVIFKWLPLLDVLDVFVHQYLLTKRLSEPFCNINFT